MARVERQDGQAASERRAEWSHLQALADMGGPSHEPRATGRYVRVDATGGGGRASIDEDAALGQPTCFGIWRRKAKPLPAKQLPGETRHATPDEAVTGQKSARGLFGASAIVKSFHAMGLDGFRDPAQPSGELSCKAAAAGDGARVSCASLMAAPDARIMASYASNIHETRADFMHETQAFDSGDLDANDGAASIEEEDTFGTPAWSVDAHDIYFVSRGDGSGKICRLGKGDYGPVYLGVWQEQEVAIKLARQKPLTLRQERAFQRQAARMHGLEHPNLVQFMGACCWKGGRRSVLVTEYMDKGDLQRLLAREELTAKFAWVRHGRTVALDIAHGLAYLHARGLRHGRLSSANVLLNRAGVAKLSDACLPQLLSHVSPAKQQGPRGERAPLPSQDLTVAPEVREGQAATLASDIYSFGVVLWELLSMEAPTGSLRPIRTPEEAPAVVAYLVECCLSRDPARRPTAASIVATLSTKRYIVPVIIVQVLLIAGALLYWLLRR